MRVEIDTIKKRIETRSQQSRSKYLKKLKYGKTNHQIEII